MSDYDFQLPSLDFLPFARGHAAASARERRIRSAPQLDTAGAVESFRPPRILQGRWIVGKRLGCGGYGYVYDALDMGGAEHGVAIKFPKNPAVAGRLRREASLMRQLADCPYIARVLHYHPGPDLPFLVLWRGGENVSRLARSYPGGRVPARQVATLGLDMLAGIAALHEIGYVHCDVKCANFVRHLLPTGCPRCFLVDFGLAHRLTSPGSPDAAAGQAHFRGTDRYASPWVHQGRRAEPRDDLWSLFYSLVRLTAGSLPWDFTGDRGRIGEIKLSFTRNRRWSVLPQYSMKPFA